jgi:hypothetical protein
MNFELFGAWPLIVAAVLGLIGVVQIASGVLLIVRWQPLHSVLNLAIGAAVALAGALTAAVALAVHGYHTFTHEEVAARISVAPSGPQRFDARVRFPDGREEVFVVAGDELYVDAHVIKWKPIANMIGLHTAYELDRIGGRYRTVEQERSALRTVYPLAPPRLLDLFDLRRRYAWLAPVVDAEYGSASFVPVDKPMEWEVRVSTSGLLIRAAR